MVAFPIVMIKYPDKSNLREEGHVLAHYGKVRAAQTGDSSLYVSTVEQRVMDDFFQLRVSFYVIRDPRPGNSATHSGSPNLS